MVVGSGDGNIYGVGLTCINRHRGSRHGEKKEGQPQEFAGQLHFWGCASSISFVENSKELSQKIGQNLLGSLLLNKNESTGTVPGIRYIKFQQKNELLRRFPLFPSPSWPPVTDQPTLTFDNVQPFFYLHVLFLFTSPKHTTHAIQTFQCFGVRI